MRWQKDSERHNLPLGFYMPNGTERDKSHIIFSDLLTWKSLNEENILYSRWVKGRFRTQMGSS